MIDDQSTFRRHLRKLLEAAGLVVVGEASHLAQAEKLAAQLQPDLAILDIMLSGEDGLAGVPLLKAAAPHMRIILVSANSELSRYYTFAAHYLGAQSFIAKEDLGLATVRSWIQPDS